MPTIRSQVRQCIQAVTVFKISYDDLLKSPAKFFLILADFLLVGELVTPRQGVREWRRFPQERSCWSPRLLRRT